MDAVNVADKTLAASLALFGAALLWRGLSPESWAADLLLAMGEAALVGGVADWFAVTALFEKPLGFPYHTAILPRRRAAFVQGATKLVRGEFLTRRKLLTLLPDDALVSMLRERLGGADVLATAKRFVHEHLAQWLRDYDGAKLSTSTAAKLRHELLSTPAGNLLYHLTRWLQTDGRDERLLAELADKARAALEGGLVRRELDAFVRGKLAQMGSGARVGLVLAQVSGVVDLDELERLTRTQLGVALRELATPGSATQARVLAAAYRQLQLASTDTATLDALAAMRGKLLRELPVEATLSEAVGQARAALSAALDDPASELSRTIDAATDAAITATLPTLAADWARLAHDVAGRSALYARELIGEVLHDGAARLTDAQLNALVYGKVESDLLWIRMNGSIVGGLLGALLWLLSRLT